MATGGFAHRRRIIPQGAAAVICYTVDMKTLLFLVLLGTTPISYAQESGEAFTFEGRVTQQTAVICDDGSNGCVLLGIHGESSLYDGKDLSVKISPQDSLSGQTISYEIGDRVLIQTQEVDGKREFFISDRVRRPALLWLGLLFVISVFAFGGLGAMKSFGGLMISFLILFVFILPRILAGDSPLFITLVGALVIMLLTFLISHGHGFKTIAALGGTAASLFLTAVLGYLFTSIAHLFGSGNEEILFLLNDYPDLNTQGIILAGIIIGSLGVLDDVTIAQASAVFELHAANARLTAMELYRHAYHIGRDHIAAAVNTLILAYAGTSLPLLLLLVGVPAGESLFTMINREMIATEIVRTLVGSIGLLAAVPLTTIFACTLAVHTVVPSDEKSL